MELMLMRDIVDKNHLKNTVDSSDYSVKSVHDGDTLTVHNKSQNIDVKIRLWGIDAPELDQEGGKESLSYLKTALENYKISKIEEMGKDRYGRTLAKIYIETSSSAIDELNLSIINYGWAWWYEKYVQNAKEYKIANELARQNKRGVYGDANAMPPWEWRKSKKNEQE